MCLEVVRLLQALAEDSVVVDLAVDGQRDGSLIVDKRLSAGVYNGKLSIASYLSCAAYRRQQCSSVRGPGLVSVRMRIAYQSSTEPLTGIVRDPVATCYLSVNASLAHTIGLLAYSNLGPDVGHCSQ